jgi:DNA-binding winged helix-turn-helix (wHTH) protein
VQLAFGDYILDGERRELRRGSEQITLEPQVFDVLLYLVENRHRVVTKDDLIGSVWGGRIVSDSTLTSRIAAARRAAGDTGGQQAVIKTYARKGFRFIGEARTWRGPEENASPPEQSEVSPAGPVPGRDPDNSSAALNWVGGPRLRSCLSII